MSIAAKLAGALLVALLLIPIVAAVAEQAPADRRTFESDGASSVRSGTAMAEAGPADEEPTARLKKKKKPQFQTRFFTE
jgi:hypothetical protein